MQDWQLDKDILVKGNKVYSPETCCFVPAEINTLFVKNNIRRGKLPIGVYEEKSGRFSSTINRGKKQTKLGTFDTIKEAFQAYKTAKENYIKEVADKWKDKLSIEVYKALHNYQVEITD